MCSPVSPRRRHSQSRQRSLSRRWKCQQQQSTPPGDHHAQTKRSTVVPNGFLLVPAVGPVFPFRPLCIVLLRLLQSHTPQGSGRSEVQPLPSFGCCPPCAGCEPLRAFTVCIHSTSASHPPRLCPSVGDPEKKSRRDWPVAPIAVCTSRIQLTASTSLPLLNEGEKAHMFFVYSKNLNDICEPLYFPLQSCSTVSTSAQAPSR
jgi:hypothetical protein